MAVALPASIAILGVLAGVIHLSLGGTLFTLNAIGYFALVTAYVIANVATHPLVIRFRWLPRLGLIGYAMTSIGAWLVIGGFYWLGYLTKAIELTLIILVIVDIYRVHGGFTGFIRDAVASVRWAVAAIRSH